MTNAKSETGNPPAGWESAGQIRDLGGLTAAKDTESAVPASGAAALPAATGPSN